MSVPAIRLVDRGRRSPGRSGRASRPSGTLFGTLLVTARGAGGDGRVDCAATSMHRLAIWLVPAPALVHGAIDVVKLVITDEVVATPAGMTAIAVWMGAASFMPYLAFLLLRGAPIRQGGVAPGEGTGVQ